MTDSLTFLREHAKQHRIEADATNSMDERTKHLVFARCFTDAADELKRLRARVARECDIRISGTIKPIFAIGANDFGVITVDDHANDLALMKKQAQRYQRVRAGELPFQVIEQFAHSGCVELYGEALDARVDHVIAAEAEQSPHD